jgi:cytochrome c biogenesis protein CcmG, thiol:disulfide interchange protein DsbE
MTNPDLPQLEQSEQLPTYTPARKPNWGRGMAWLIIILVFLCVLALLGVVGGQMFKVREDTFKKVGKPVPNFTLTTFDGEQIELASLKGKVVVINFWASWCIPCEQEAADLEAAWREYAPGGEVVFLGVDWTDTEKNGKTYLEKFDITYPNGQDLGTRISQKFRITGVPETYIVDREGKLAYFKLSPFVSLEEIKAAIEPLIKE